MKVNRIQKSENLLMGFLCKQCCSFEPHCHVAYALHEIAAPRRQASGFDVIRLQYKIYGTRNVPVGTLGGLRSLPVFEPYRSWSLSKDFRAD